MKKTLFFILPLLLLPSCRKEDVTVPSNQQQTAGDPTSSYPTLYVLNEGNWGANKASIDILDLQSGTYTRNVYAERNPQVVKELGDCGNDIAVYGQRLYAVINQSHKVEVMDLSAHRINQIDISTPRYIAFQNQYAYVTSYVSTSDQLNVGAVYQVDTATLQVTAEAVVGPQPDELVIQDNLLYCTCSGGYNYPNYDSTLSVVDITTMKEIRKLTVGINPIRIKEDSHGRLWVLCSGNYVDVTPQLVVLQGECVVQRFTVNAANMALCGDTLYYIGTYPNTYGRIDLQTLTEIPGSFITDGTDADIQTPYGLLVNPSSHTIYLTDVMNYVSSGKIYGFNPQGKKIFEAQTGDIPGHVALH